MIDREALVVNFDTVGSIQSFIIEEHKVRSLFESINYALSYKNVHYAKDGCWQVNIYYNERKQLTENVLKTKNITDIVE